MTAVALSLLLDAPRTGLIWDAFHTSIGAFVLVVAWLVGTLLAVISTDDLEKEIGIKVLEFLHALEITTEQAADIMLVDVSNLRSMLRGEGKYHLGVVHIARLPFKFLGLFAPWLAFTVMKRNCKAVGKEIGLSN